MWDTIYRWANNQVAAMLALAEQKHPDTFLRDCLTDPCLISTHWQPQLAVRMRDAYASDDRMPTTDYDAAGFCIPPEKTTDGRYHLVVNKCGYPPRDYFTLLHELGHYLQHTDIDLWSALLAFDDKATAKEAEETACNLFASKALMPDVVVATCKGSEWKADAAAKLYTTTKASRPAVVRRIAPLLDHDGWLTLIGRHDELKIRAYPNGTAEYDQTLDIEWQTLQRFRAEQSSADAPLLEKTYTNLSDKNSTQRYTSISVAESTSSREGSFWFILVQR